MEQGHKPQFPQHSQKIQCDGHKDRCRNRQAAGRRFPCRCGVWHDTIEEIEVQIGELQSQIRSIQQEKISGDNIYRLLLAFDEVYHSATEAEQKEFMKAFIERIEMFPEKRKDGSWIKKIVFNFPVPVDGEEVKELPLETETTVETVVLLSKLNVK